MEAKQTISFPFGRVIQLTEKSIKISVKLKDAFDAQSRKHGLKFVCRAHLEKSLVYGHLWPNIDRFWPFSNLNFVRKKRL